MATYPMIPSQNPAYAAPSPFGNPNAFASPYRAPYGNSYAPRYAPSSSFANPNAWPASPNVRYMPVLRQLQPATDTLQRQSQAPAPVVEASAETVSTPTEPRAKAPEPGVKPTEPVIAEAPPLNEAGPLAGEKAAVPASANTSAVGEEAPMSAVAKATPAAEPAVPESFAEETGDKVGKLVTQIIENNPQLETQLQDLQLENILSDPNSFANRLKEGLQGSRVFRTLMKFDKRMVSSLPAEYEPTAREFFKWLKAAPTDTGLSGL